MVGLCVGLVSGLGCGLGRVRVNICFLGGGVGLRSLKLRYNKAT